MAHRWGQACIRCILDRRAVALSLLDQPRYGVIRVGRSIGLRLSTLGCSELEVRAIPFGRNTCTLLYIHCVMTHLRAHFILTTAEVEDASAHSRLIAHFILLRIDALLLTSSEVFAWWIIMVVMLPLDTLVASGAVAAWSVVVIVVVAKSFAGCWCGCCLGLNMKQPIYGLVLRCFTSCRPLGFKFGGYWRRS